MKPISLGEVRAAKTSQLSREELDREIRLFLDEGGASDAQSIERMINLLSASAKSADPHPLAEIAVESLSAAAALLRAGQESGPG